MNRRGFFSAVAAVAVGSLVRSPNGQTLFIHALDVTDFPSGDIMSRFVDEIDRDTTRPLGPDERSFAIPYGSMREFFRSGYRYLTFGARRYEPRVTHDNWLVWVALEDR